MWLYFSVFHSEKWIVNAKDFLKSGATAKLLVIPPQLLSIFREIDCLLEQQKQALMDMVKMSKQELVSCW